MTTVATEAVLEQLPRGLLIGGRWVAGSGAELAVEDPGTGQVLTHVAGASTADALAALDAAVAVQESWAATAARERSQILQRAFALVHERRDDLAALMTLEMGKPLADAHAEIDYGAEFLRWFAEEAVRVTGDFRATPEGGARILVSHRPVGPCLLVTPWNFPLAMATRKIAPAVAAGCTMLLKPAPETPLTALAFAALMQEAGLPAGVLSVLTTDDAPTVVGALLADGRVRKLSFTGSTEVGRLLLAQCGAQVVRTSMELGGNAPFVVFADADLDAAVEGAVLAKMRNMGEACTAANRFYVQEPAAQEFARRLARRMGDMVVGHGMDEGSEVGPLIDAAACARVDGLVRDAVARGAHLLTGGECLERPGHFYAPTVLDAVPPDARILAEEAFGPVAPVMAFTTEAEAIAAANDTEHGLVAYVYTRDLARALRVGEAMQAGMVALNRGIVSNAAAPFGGIKQSGIGREGGREGIHEYLDTKYLSV